MTRSDVMDRSSRFDTETHRTTELSTPGENCQVLQRQVAF